MTLAETLAAAETKVRHNMYSDSDPDKSFLSFLQFLSDGWYPVVA